MTLGYQPTQEGTRDEYLKPNHVGLYIAARVGYALDGAADFWRRMAVEHPDVGESGFAAAHRSAPERFVAIGRTVEEIAGKRERGEELLPEIEA